MTECFLGREPSLSPEKLACMRAIVRDRAIMLITESNVRLQLAAENVDPLNRIRFPAEEAEGCEAVAFMCATVGVHVDTDMVPRWNTLTYLGTLDQEDDVEHVLYVQNPPGWRDNPDDAVTPDGTDPLSLGGTTHSLVLKPGDVVLLDVEYPHWFRVRTGGVERGDVIGKSPVLGKLSPSLKGVPLKTITALFVATASDTGYVTGDALHRVYDSMHLVTA